MKIFFVSLSLIFLLFCLEFTQQQAFHTHMHVPVHSLKKYDICSILSVALPTKMLPMSVYSRLDYQHSRRTMLYFLLSIKSMTNNKPLMKFINQCDPGFTWSMVEEKYNELKQEVEQYKTDQNATEFGDYWELQIRSDHYSIRMSRAFISQFRSHGFQANELKLYWNYQQIYSLKTCLDHNPITDRDTRFSLLKSPVRNRKHRGIITDFKRNIHNAISHIPDDKQVIVLEFANERIPGGYYLSNPSTGEQEILRYSDGYRALLDLKYKMMDGGYMLPEYGVAYIKNVRFFRNLNTERTIDMIVAACYDLSNHDSGLYKVPSKNDTKQIRVRTLRKFRAIIASAVANTDGDGSNTHLVLGATGTGVSSDNEKMIYELFKEVLDDRLMGSEGPIKEAFDTIWLGSP